ncbi:MAG: FAD-dependent oxidoreductase [Deltaproteobacteria bacterium]|uniref:FAD-dependent oxidoreductase n=1 Tax=Candidatus Zymogenus saltonus TaxID=2844893 RepID=A0A9D8KC94_9DELT|nr:FAD-dependent oxidoreductase [Candidatus Zymogenus saltonus]
METDPLFMPIEIKGVEIKNRIYMPAMHLNMVEDYKITDRIIDFYAERAKGGAGAIVTGYATVNITAGNRMIIGAHRDEFIPGLTKLADAIKGNGAVAGLQINHSGRYNISFLIEGNRPAVAPSAVRSRFTREMPRALEPEEVKETIADFARAAARTKEAGFDFVEVLSGAGYLISEFLSEITNKREDEWGGDFENRMRFGIEIARAVRAAVGDDYPVLFRINGNDFMEGGIGRERTKIYAKRLVENGVDALCINMGWHETRVPTIVTEVPRGAFNYLTAGIKREVDVPVVASHRINDPGLAREMLLDGICDMVAMGRALISDPYLPRKVKGGKEESIVHCIGCAQGCFDHLFEMRAVECLVNPLAGHEKERAIEETKEPKRIMVVGGGAAGMAAAAVASMRGHGISLFEKGERLGGQLNIAGIPPGRGEFLALSHDLAGEVKRSGVSVSLNVDVDEEIVKREKPDLVILATGARPMMLNIPGADLPNVAQAWDVLEDRARTGRRVLVIGGGAVGTETALFLAGKGTPSPEALRFLLIKGAEPPEDLRKIAVKGIKEVMLIEMLDRVGSDIGKSTRWGILQELERAGVNVMTGTKAVEITETSVNVNVSGELKEIPADTVVIAAGSVSHNPLEEKIKKMGIPVKVIGDAGGVAKAFEAVHNGFELGRKI